jgi:predicted membrane protein
MPTPTLLFFAIVFSFIGLSFFMYGKRQKAIVPLVDGIALCIFPYFVQDVLLMLVIGAGLIAIPYFVRI